MTLFSLILALLLEQFRPLNAARWLHAPLATLGDAFERRFNDGQARHGTVAWCVMVLPPVLLTAVIYALLYAVHPLVAFAFNIVVLYYTMGFRHASHFYTRIHAALRAQDLDRARELLGQWRKHDYSRSSTEEITRLSIESALVGSHRQVFAIVLLFILLPGPSGAVLYRMTEFFGRYWGEAGGPGMPQFGRFARRAFQVLDWLPARVTAMAFSIVGDFEDAAWSWRTQAPNWPDHNEGTLIAAGAGALGVRLGQPINESGELVDRPEMGTGDEAEVEFLQSTIGLIRRTLVLNVLVLLLIQVSYLAG